MTHKSRLRSLRSLSDRFARTIRFVRSCQSTEEVLLMIIARTMAMIIVTSFRSAALLADRNQSLGLVLLYILFGFGQKIVRENLFLSRLYFCIFLFPDRAVRMSSFVWREKRTEIELCAER